MAVSPHITIATPLSMALYIIFSVVSQYIIESIEYALLTVRELFKMAAYISLVLSGKGTASFSSDIPFSSLPSVVHLFRPYRFFLSLDLHILWETEAVSLSFDRNCFESGYRVIHCQEKRVLLDKTQKSTKIAFESNTTSECFIRSRSENILLTCFESTIQPSQQR